MIHTALGPISPDQLGRTLMHEHVMTDYSGADFLHKEHYDRQEIVDTMLPYLLELSKAGCNTFVDATPAGSGRDVLVLKECALQSKMYFITCTGTFKANAVPTIMRTMEIDQIAELWIAEFAEGIESTGIRPGFIKVALDDGAISDDQKKILRAGIRTSLKTGMAIQAHTILPQTMREAYTIITEEGLPVDRYIWTHSDCQQDIPAMIEMGRKGVWLQIDSIGYIPYENHLQMLKTLIAEGLTDQLLLSQDRGWYVVGKDKGKYVNPYHLFFTEFLPLCKASGIPDEIITQLTVTNPARVLNIE